MQPQQSKLRWIKKSGGGYEQYELIESVTIDEPTNQPIQWTSEDGFDDILVIATGVRGTGTSFNFNCKFQNVTSGIYQNQQNQVSPTTEKTFILECIRYLNNRMKIERRGNLSGSAEINSGGLKDSLKYEDKINTVNVSTNTGETFTAGTFTLYGKIKF